MLTVTVKKEFYINDGKAHGKLYLFIPTEGNGYIRSELVNTSIYVLWGPLLPEWGKPVKGREFRVDSRSTRGYADWESVIKELEEIESKAINGITQAIETFRRLRAAKPSEEEKTYNFEV